MKKKFSKKKSASVFGLRLILTEEQQEKEYDLIHKWYECYDKFMNDKNEKNLEKLIKIDREYVDFINESVSNNRKKLSNSLKDKFLKKFIYPKNLKYRNFKL